MNIACLYPVNVAGPVAHEVRLVNAGLDNGAARPGAIGGPNSVLRSANGFGARVLDRVGLERAVNDVRDHH